MLPALPIYVRTPPDDDDTTCPKCGDIHVPVEILRDEKPDGTILGYAEATCQSCDYELTEAEIIEGRK